MGFKQSSPEWGLLHRNLRVQMTDHVLEIACGNHKRSLVRKMIQQMVNSYSFCDLNNRHQDLRGFVRMLGPTIIEADDETFDHCVLFQALHNIAAPWKLIPEICRVTKSGGKLTVIDSAVEDLNRHPVDCGRWWQDGVEVLLVEGGFIVRECHMEEANGTVAPNARPLLSKCPVYVIGVGEKP